jgi:hypothetical protein
MAWTVIDLATSPGQRQRLLSRPQSSGDAPA